jgi:hypothetical protein
MSKLSQQVRETQAEIATMNERILELEKPLEKPVAKDYSNSNDYLIAVRNYENGERDRASAISAIEEFLPIQSERLKALEVKLQAEESESREFYKALCERADDFIAAYAIAFEQYKSLMEFSQQRPQSWASRHPQQFPIETPGVRLEKIALLKLDSQERLLMPGGNMADSYIENNAGKLPVAIAG